MDFNVQTDNSDYGLYIDAGLDKATSFMWDGWAKVHETWTRTGNHTFTISGDVTTKYRKGTKVRYTDGGVEYGVISSSSYSSPNTTVNLIVNSDYAMSGNPSAMSISYIANPEGFPSYFNFTSTVTYDGGTTDPTSNTVNTAIWRMIGKDFFVTITSTLVKGTGNRARTIYSIPITPQAISILPGFDSVGTGALALSVVYAYTDGKIYYEKTMGFNGNYYINGSFAF
jgi:hypothetical protein